MPELTSVETKMPGEPPGARLNVPVSLPVIASGGAGNAAHVAAALAIADAALLASILHEQPARLTSLRNELRDLGVPLRDAA